MLKQRVRRYQFVAALALVFSFGFTSMVAAGTPQSSSAHYSVNEVQIGGSGAALNDCSGSYCAKFSVGDTVVGSGKSTHYSAQFGANTTDIPLLEVITAGGTSNLGVLDTGTTGTASAVIKVRNYLSNGYVLQIAGSPPSQGVHALTALATLSTSQPGTEQFGINLAANTTPSVGANPVQVPSGTFSFGTATSDYGSANLFKYVNGDIVAQSPTSSGETDYTLSMILNVSNVTPGGQYTANFSAVAVPTY